MTSIYIIIPSFCGWSCEPETVRAQLLPGFPFHGQFGMESVPDPLNRLKFKKIDCCTPLDIQITNNIIDEQTKPLTVFL